MIRLSVTPDHVRWTPAADVPENVNRSADAGFATPVKVDNETTTTNTTTTKGTRP